MPPAPRLALVALGCPKNVVDAETALGALLGEGYALAMDPADADLVLLLTCAFIEPARAESHDCLRRLLDEAAGSGRRVAVAGCLAQREGRALLEAYPDLAGVVGLGAYPELPALVRRMLSGETVCAPAASAESGAFPISQSIPEGPRLLGTGGAYAWLRITEGCDNRCAYCAIPAIRGPLRSRAADAVVEEARALVTEAGARELVLVGQDTAAFGMDRSARSELGPLLESLLAATGDAWIRILYAHPAHLGDDVIGLLGAEPRLLGYLDLPLQHVNDGVLRRMGRGVDRSRIETLLARIHKHVPDPVLRTTMLTGFPGEDETAFAELLAFVREGRFRHLGAFAWSPEPGTPAAAWSDHVPAEVAARRRDALLEAQQAVAFAWLDSRVGGETEVLLEAEEADGLRGRSRAEAPEIDGAILLPASAGVVGDRVRACLTARVDYELLAEPVA